MRPWTVSLGLGGAVLAIGFARPSLTVALTLVFAAAVLVIELRLLRTMERPLRRIAQPLFAAQFAALGAFAFRAWHESLSVPGSRALPSFADLLAPWVYVLVTMMLLRLARLRTSGRDLDAWLDSALITVALGVGLWTTVMSDYLDGSAAGTERLLVTAYFVGALVLFACVLRVLAAPGVVAPSYILLFLAVLTGLAVDLSYTLAYAMESRPGELQFVTPMVYALALAAFLHPSAPTMVTPPSDLEPHVRPGRAALLAGALLVPQGAVLLHFNSLTQLDLVVLGCATVLLGSLVLARFVRLVRARDRLLRNETALRSVGERLLQDVTAAQVEQTIREELPKLLPEDTLLSGIQLGDGTMRAAPAYGRHSALGKDLKVLAEALPADDSVAETSQQVDVGSGSVSMFAVRAQGPSDTYWFWSLNETVLGRHDRDALRSLARETALALRGAAAAEGRAREESDKRWKESIIRSERRFRALVQHSSDIVAVVDPEGSLSYVSPAIRSLLGYDPATITGISVLELVHPDDRASAESAFEDCRKGRLVNRLELQVLDTTGHPHTLEIALADHLDTPEVGGLVVNARDVTVARELEENLERASSHDPTTGLINRASLEQEIALSVAEAKGQPYEAAVLVVRLEQFEMLTDGLGFEAVDNLLSRVADRIRGAVRLVDLVASVEGPQFAVLVRHTYGVNETEQLAQRVLTALTGSIDHEGTSVHLDAYVGIAMSGTKHGDDLLRLGHTALRAGTADGNRIQGFESPMVESVMEQLELRARLSAAIQDNELFLMYQPLVSLEDGRIEGAEALVRWRHPERGVVGPVQFIPIAEETGLVLPLGEWVLKQVCRQVAEWESRKLLTDDMTFSLNLSAVQLADPNILDVISSALRMSRVNPSRLVVELTETFFTSDDDGNAIETLEKIRAMGLRVAIDDFGTGYSSLERIARFPADIVKIDRAFVSPLDEGNQRDVDVLARIIEMIDGLGAISVAEGIETGSEADVLRELGCRKGQGYFFDRPMEVDVFEIRLKSLETGAAAAAGADSGTNDNG